jgi:signal transduction histidine kinase
MEDSLEILIQDDGCGFKTGDEPQGNGLVNLHERMHKLGGHCQIQSSPNAGTSVILRLPLSGKTPALDDSGFLTTVNALGHSAY